ncbi:MAG: hypothetical protein JKY52_13085 [Flavobacteriales bacterium]|nr:hypothetical protein [Flavobacteriales bacterium]
MNGQVTDFRSSIASLAVVAFIIVGCGGEMKDIEKIPQDEVTVSENTNLIKLDNRLFHFQNPVQTALVMKDLAKPFSTDALNPTGNAENYSTAFKQAVNIGIYGADLGYITANGKNQEAINHLSAIKKLAEDLDMASSFDFNQMEKFGNNVGDQQQMLAISTNAYKNCEAFLKEEDRHDLFGLILAGAMVEGLHFAVSFAKEENNQEVIERMADQVTSLDNIILVLNPHYQNETAPELSRLVDQLLELQKAFKALNMTYKYVASEVDQENKLCTIKSESTYSMTPSALSNITRIVTEIRDSITS